MACKQHPYRKLLAQKPNAFFEWYPESRNAGHKTDRVSRFPECRLHGTRIVDRLPDGCLMDSANPSVAIQGLLDRSFRRLCPGPGYDPSGGLADRARAETCIECRGRLLTHPHVRFLRAREHLQERGSGRKNGNEPARTEKTDRPQPAAVEIPTRVRKRLRRQG